MKRRTRIGPAFATLTVVLLAVAGCGDGGKKTTQPDGNGGQTVTYTDDVQPILQAGCTCHHPGGEMHESEPLDSYQNVFSRRARVRERAGVLGSMPPTGPLPQNQRDTIIAWVDAGAPE